MTKKAILELIQKRCQGKDTNAQFHLLYLNSYCDNVWQELVSMMHLNPNVDGSFYSKEYSTTVSGALGSYYTTLPQTIINLPRTGSGVASVRTTGTREYYAPVSESDFTYLPTQEVYRQAEDIYFYVSYDTVFYGGAMTATEASAGVTIRLVIPFSKYDMDEELPLPVTQQNIFLDMVVERLIGTPEPNLLNKNNE